MVSWFHFLEVYFVLLQTDMALLGCRGLSLQVAGTQRKWILENWTHMQRWCWGRKGRVEDGEAGERHVLTPKDSVCEMHTQDNQSEYLLCADTSLSEFNETEGDTNE